MHTALRSVEYNPAPFAWPTLAVAVLKCHSHSGLHSQYPVQLCKTLHDPTGRSQLGEVRLAIYGVWSSFSPHTQFVKEMFSLEATPSGTSSQQGALSPSGAVEGFIGRGRGGRGLLGEVICMGNDKWVSSAPGLNPSTFPCTEQNTDVPRGSVCPFCQKGPWPCLCLLYQPHQLPWS